ncbi:MAG TPA: periplasmic heavy metal sensor [Bryobacteraceae bacterium]|nr:periplasmic heavy metal sensor [Bryobacteraceae bacterium]
MRIGFATAIAGMILSGALCAQSARSQFPWWNSPVVSDLNLTADQTRQIEATVSEFRAKLRELRAAVNKADAELQSAFNEDPVDQDRASAAIDDLASARAELTKTLSLMDLKLRTVLTGQQWQALQERQAQRSLVERRRRGRGRKGDLSKRVLEPAGNTQPAASAQK